VGVQASLNVSRDGGCRFERSLYDSHQFVEDFTIVRSTGAILAIVQATDGTSSRLEESTDGGASWAVVGDSLPTGLVLSVDVAPSDPARIYVSALASDAQGELLASSDHGRSWSKVALPNTSVDEVPYIALVHPTDPNRIFVRTDAWTNRDVRDT